MAASKRPQAFVTDGAYPNALAAVRALGRNGFDVTVAERRGIPPPEVIGFWSVHCSQKFRYPDPQIDPAATVQALSDLLRAKPYDVVIPVGLDMTKLFVEHRELLGGRSVLPHCDSFCIASDKRRTFTLAASLGLPVPRTVSADRWESLEPPIVFKHYRSGAVIAPTRVAAAECIGRLQSRIAEYLAQEYVPGCNGFGYFGFFQNGREAAHFVHQRLVQLPREGGPSVVARGVRNSRVRELGRALLEALRWNGAAMVEFKRSSNDGEFYLMEVNPKLWGSLDLAIQSGYNFPLWIARAVMSGAPPYIGGTIEDLTYQWVVPSGLKSFLRYPEFRLPFLRNLVSTRVRTDLRISDPLPTLAGLFTMAIHAVR